MARHEYVGYTINHERNDLVSSQLHESLDEKPETLGKWVREVEDTGEPLVNGITAATANQATKTREQRASSH